jgi:hypothetical protein
MRLIKESFSSSKLRETINQMNKDDKNMFLGDLGYISTSFDQDISNFDDNQIGMVNDVNELDLNEKLFIYNLKEKCWYFPIESNFSDDLSDYDEGREIDFEEFSDLPNGTVLIYQLDSRYDESKGVGVKHTQDGYEVSRFIIQNNSNGASPYDLYQTIFSLSWVISASNFGDGEMYIAIPKYKKLQKWLPIRIGEIRKDGVVFDNPFPIDVQPKKSGDLFIINPYNNFKLKNFKKGPSGPSLVFYLDRFKSTGLSQKMTKRIKDNEDGNIKFYTNKLIDKHKDDRDYLLKYFSGREYKLFFILNHHLDFSTRDIYSRKESFYIFYKNTLNTLNELKKTNRFNQIMELNNIVTKKINSFDLKDHCDREAFKYYFGMIKNISSNLLSNNLDDKDFKSKYKTIKNISI